MESLHHEFKDRGLEIIAINISDSPKIIEHYLKKQRATFKIALGRQTEIRKEFRCLGFPTNYLIDPEGKDRKSVV